VLLGGEGEARRWAFVKGVPFLRSLFPSPGLVGQLRGFTSSFILTMATFISYQPPEITPPFSRDPIGVSASVGPPDSVPSWQSWQHTEWAWPSCGVKFVDYEPPPALEILESRRDFIHTVPKVSAIPVTTATARATTMTTVIMTARQVKFHLLRRYRRWQLTLQTLGFRIIHFLYPTLHQGSCHQD